MKKYEWNSKQVIRTVIMILAALLLAWLIYTDIRESDENGRITDLRAASEDGRIEVTWDLPWMNRVKNIEISVKGNGEETSEILSRDARSYSFENGTYGKLYTISVKELYRDGTEGEAQTKKRLFLEYDRLPDLPLVVIETAGGENPPWSVAKKPDGDKNIMGSSVENNDYVDGTMVFRRSEQEDIAEETEIRVRGNTSSVGGGKQSYKLKLHEKEDMLGLGEDHADREWELLNTGTNLNFFVGEYLSERCGMEWIEHGTFVNVMLNGDFRGIYYLTECVSRGEAHGEISKTGYSFENDAYWWKSGTVYFRTDAEPHTLAYTFKYPDIRTSDDHRLYALRKYMNKITNLINSADPSVSDYIDFDSFAAWVMIRDIMHCGDAGGTNMYYYLYDFDEEDYTANRLKMGPAWDFDASMRFSENWHDDITGWSDQHERDYTLFRGLFKIRDFCSFYKEKWESVSDGLEEDFDSTLEKLEEEEGEAIGASRALNAARWERGTWTSLRDEIDYDEDFVRQRAEWISSAVEDW